MVNGARGGDSEGGFWDFSRAFEAEHSCSLLCLISLQNTRSPLYPHKTTELIAMIGPFEGEERAGERGCDWIAAERGLRGGGQLLGEKGWLTGQNSACVSPVFPLHPSEGLRHRKGLQSHVSWLDSRFYHSPAV